MSSLPQAPVVVSSPETVLHADGRSSVLIGNGAQLFGAEFQRDGRDLLLLTDEAPAIRVVGYFNGAPVDLVAGNGGLLRGAVVETLAGPVAPGQYAQAGGATAGMPIGQVEALDGGASVQRSDGSVQALQVGMPVFQHDVVATEAGASASLTFVDGTIFSLAARSRMVLDELIYDPDSTENSGAFSLVQGSFVFIAGQVAKTGGMEITTPAATMGIRGTTVRVDVTTVGGETTVECTLNRDPDGGLGRIEIFDLDGALLTTVTGTDFRWAISGSDGQLAQIPRSLADMVNDAPLLDSAGAAFTLAMRRVASGETFVDLPGRSRIGVDPGEGAEPQPEFNTGVGRDLDDVGTDLPGLSRGGAVDPIAPPAPESQPELRPRPVPEGGSEGDAGPAPGPAPDTGPDSGNDSGPDTVPPPEPDDTYLEIEEDSRYVGAFPRTGPDGKPLVYELAEDPANGTVEMAVDGRFAYAPVENYEGTDSFAYTVTDATGASGTGKTDVLVIGVNDAPVLTPTTFTLDETGALTVDLAALADDPDPDEDGTTLTFSVNLNAGPAALLAPETAPETAAETSLALSSGPTPGWSLRADVEPAPDYGSVVVSGSILTFVPGPDFASLAAGETAVISFDLAATDAAGETTTQTYELTITGTNDAPVLSLGALETRDDGPSVQLDLASLAYDPDTGDTLTYAVVTPPPAGHVSLDGSRLVFSPGDDFRDLAQGETRAVTLEISVTDAAGASAVQQVAVTVTGTNDAPTLEAAALDAVEDGPAVVLDLSDLAADPDAGDTLSFGLVTPPALGSASLAGALLSFAPGADFQTLAAGETTVVTLEVSVTDAAGAETVQQVAVTVTGTNDAPTAQGAIGVVAVGGVLDGQVVTADPDGDAAGFELSVGPDHGSVALDAATGAYRYTASDGFAGRDSFQVQVSDGQGGSDTATIDIAVASDSATGETGQVASVGIDARGSVQVGAAPIEAAAINVAFVLDSSGSIGAQGWADEVADVADAIALLAAQYEGAAVAVNVQVISYSNGVETTATYDLLTESEALIAEVMALEWQAAGTRWDLAFAQTEAFFDSQSPGDSNFMFFITDGVPTGDYQAALDSLTDAEANGYSVDIEAFGLGEAPDMAVLDQIDSDGMATAVDSPADLAEGLSASPIFAAQLVDFDLRLVADGIDMGRVATAADLGDDGAFDLAIAGIEGIADLLGDSNIFTATATFDFDGDLTTTDDQQLVATVAELGRSEDAVEEDGGSGDDLLFGSDLGDTIRGGAGDDLILGLDGDDALRGGGGSDQVLAGAGDDTIRVTTVDERGETIDGGAGHDVLRLGLEGDLDAGLFALADISGIEVLDLENDMANTLDLTLSDVLDLTDDGEAGIGALVAEADLTILGEQGDRLTLTAESGQEVVKTGARHDAEGQAVVTYDFLGGAGEVLASLVIDADVTVQTAAPAA